MRLSTGGGFVPEGADFRTPPELLIVGDGTVYLPGAQIEIFPAPLLPAITTATLDPDGVRAVLDAADKAGLLKPPPSYEPASDAAQVADAPTTSLEIHANGETFDHQAYALGFQPNGVESTPEPQRPRPLRDQLKDLHGPGRGGAPDRRRGLHAGALRRHRPCGDPRGAGADRRTRSPPRSSPWPDAAPPLASMTACTEVPAAAVGDTFDQANQLTRFSQAGATYTVFVRVLLPGETCATSFSAGPPTELTVARLGRGRVVDRTRGA